MKKILVACLTGTLITATAFNLHSLSKMVPPIFLPNLIRFWLAAITLGCIQGFQERVVPALSIRLINSAVAAGVLFMAVPNVLWLWSMHYLPFSFVVLSMGLVPLWINVLHNYKNRDWLIGGGVSLVGLVAVGLTLVPIAHTSASGPLPPVWTCVVACLVASSTSALAGLLARNLFWIHATTNLNIWSMIAAAVFLFPAALIFGEFNYIHLWPARYWGELALLTLVFTGCGAQVYRRFSFHLDRFSASLLLLLAPLFTLAYSLSTGDEHLSPVGIVGWLAACIPLFYFSRRGSPLHWLYHYLANSRRVGDRLEVDIEGFVKTDQANGAIRITSISIGGIGYESEVYCPVSDKAVVTIPMGKNFTQVTFDTICAYCAKTKTGGTVWRGGLAFQKMDLASTQILAEFVARLATADRSTGPAIEIRKEYALRR
ncbi:MAG: DMT family transporter [Deltaproteobacteria bacterium]|nr:DMT family transporter [Deltaproteobacteria bacterium]